MKPDMKKTLIIGFIYAITLAAMILPALAHATGSSAAGHKVKRENGNAAAKLSTTMAFSGSRVGGQYQVPSEATAKIENEQPIEELLGLRTQFPHEARRREKLIWHTHIVSVLKNCLARWFS